MINVRPQISKQQKKARKQGRKTKKRKR